MATSTKDDYPEKVRSILRAFADYIHDNEDSLVNTFDNGCASFTLSLEYMCDGMHYPVVRVGAEKVSRGLLDASLSASRPI